MPSRPPSQPAKRSEEKLQVIRLESRQYNNKGGSRGSGPTSGLPQGTNVLMPGLVLHLQLHEGDRRYDIASHCFSPPPKSLYIRVH